MDAIGSMIISLHIGLLGCIEDAGLSVNLSLGIDHSASRINAARRVRALKN